MGSIKSFRDKRLKRLFENEEAESIKGLDSAWIGKLRNRFHAIATATEVEQVGKFPGWRLHPHTTGKWKGFWSVDVSGNWRLLFRFEDGDAFDLSLDDPH
jgi:proteic killer suppression protein